MQTFSSFSHENLYILAAFCITVADDTHANTYTNTNTHTTESCRAVNVRPHAVCLLINLIDCDLCMCVCASMCVNYG